MALRKLARTREVDELVSNDSAFDAKVVQSLIDVQHAFAKPGSRDLAELEVECFGWIIPVLRARAVAARIPESSVAWGPPLTVQEVASFISALGQLLFGLFDGGRNLVGEIAFAEHRVDHIGARKSASRKVSASEWVDKVLAALPIYSRLALIDGDVVSRSVPLLTTLPRCLAYGYARVLDTESPLHGRIRQCADTRQGLHWFLAVGSRADRLYCSSAHQNAHAQFRHRQRQSGESST